MDLDDGAVQRHRFELEAHNLCALQLFEDALQHSVFGPAIHTGVNRVPVAKAPRQAAPFATVLGNIPQWR